MKTYTLLDTALLFLMVSFLFKAFLAIERLGGAGLSMITLPEEFQYLAALLF